MIGQFRGPYSPARTLKFIYLFIYLFIFDMLLNCCLIYIANKGLKLSFTLNYVLKRANGLKVHMNVVPRSAMNTYGETEN